MPIGYVLKGPFLFHKSLGMSQEVDQESGIGKTDKKEQILKGRPPSILSFNPQPFSQGLGR
jgi:hypothetical protein